MNYFKIIYRTGEEDWETSEIIIDENQHKKIQEQMASGADYVFIKDKATIKRTSITSIASANDIVGEYQKQGVKINGLLTPAEKPKLTGNVNEPRKIGDYLKDTHFEYYQKMGWEHKEDCSCKNKPNQS